MPSHPERIGPYRIIAPLGTGGMATVYRAEQAALSRTVALKVISEQYAGDPRFRVRFQREAQAGARIQHPHVVATYDAGEADGRLYLALELVTGGDLLALLARRGGRLEEAPATQILAECLRGLAAIEAEGMVHRDLKPANVFLDGHGRAKLADLGLARECGGEQLTQAGLIVGTPAYMPPEQAQGATDLDIRADLYALGATTFHLLTGEPPYRAGDPVSTLVQVINQPTPDPRDLRGDISGALAGIIATLMAKDRQRRYPSVRQALGDVEDLLAGRRPRLAMGERRAPAETQARPATPVQAPQPTPPGIPAGAQRIDPVMLAQLAKRVLIAPDQLSAAIVLAPGASFPRQLLERMLAAAGICYGLDPASVHEATRTSAIARRIILARGDPPTPGCGGRSVAGEELPATPSTVAIVVADDAMSAVAICRPGQLASREDLEDALRRSGIRHGVDAAAVRLLLTGPLPADGRVAIARGTPPVPGRADGFHLPGGSLHAGSNVAPGDVVARWVEGQPASEGCDVLGRPLVPPPAVALPLEEQAGDGTEVARDREGRLVLRALRAGTSLRNPDGRIRVAGVVEIAGDLTAGSAPVETDDVVVVRGSVQSGAIIRSTSDVVVCGDLADAAITAGGSLQIGGGIAAGQQQVTAGGVVEAGCLTARRVVAAAVRIRGAVRGSEVVATGDIEIDRAVGGRIAAGGSVRIGELGDAQGTTTEVWAGHTLAYGDAEEVTRLQAKKVETDRLRLVATGQQLKSDLDAAAQTRSRLAAGRVVDPAAVAAAEQRVRSLSDRHARVAGEAERHRQTLAAVRTAQERIRGLADDAAAAVVVTKVAHAGVVARLADVEPEVLDAPRLRYRLCLGPADPAG